MACACCRPVKMTKAKQKSEGFIVRFLEKKYPGIREVINLMDNIRERCAKQYVEGLQNDETDGPTDDQAAMENGKEKIPFIDKQEENSDVGDNVNDTSAPLATGEEDETPRDNPATPCTLFREDDGKWRPILMTLGLIYKLQKVTDDGWYDCNEVFIKNLEEITTLVNTAAFYWWYSIEVVQSMKGWDDDEVLYNAVATGLKVDREDVVFVIVKDAEKAKVEEHCPDICIVVHHEKKEVILTICGTKVFPSPSAADILMDMYANNVPFCDGVAHQGMASATENIFKRCLSKLCSRLAQHPGYRLVVLGYSLGAGVAQLVTIRLTDGPEKAQIPPGQDIHCVTFGSPPVYKADKDNYTNHHIINVYNHNDGLATLTLHTVTKLFLQIRAINRLCLGRRRTLNLLRKRLGNTVELDGVRRHLIDQQQIDNTEWKDIRSAVAVVNETGFAALDHAAHHTYLMKRGDVGHVVRHFEGLAASRNLSSNVKLRGGMFNDHMPWGYAYLFQDCGGDQNGLSLELISRM